MPAVYILVYYRAGLYADAAINVYFLLASVYGLVCWLMPRKGSPVVSPITTTPRSVWLPLTIITIIVWGIIAVALHQFTDSTVPVADAFTTALSISAMWMLAKKYIEQWLIWIVVDVASAALYFYKGLDLTALLYLLYAGVAVAGYRKWRQLLQTDSTPCL